MTPNPHHRRSALGAMYVGVLLTVLATVAPYVDRATAGLLATHIREGYPDFPPARVDSAVTTWLVLLTVVGVLGLAGWLLSIRAVSAGKPWARWAATGLFALGTAVALTALLVEDTSGATGLAPHLGWIGILPSVAGAVAVTMLWRGAPVSTGTGLR